MNLVARKQIARIATIWTMIVSMAILPTPIPIIQMADAAGQIDAKAKAPKMVAHPISTQERANHVKAVRVAFNLATAPTDIQLSMCRAFTEPLTATDNAVNTSENSSLATAIKAYKAQTDSEDFSVLTGFISAHPNSRWRASLELNLGILEFGKGYLSNALNSWQSAWEATRNATTKSQIEVAERAGSELVQLEARLGHIEDLRKHLAEIGTRKFHGSSSERLDAGQQGIFAMEHNPGTSYKCGPYAVNSLLSLKEHKANFLDLRLKAVRSTDKGTNLAQVQQWAKEVGLDYQVAKRAPNAEIITPCVMHWAVGHFCAITKKQDGLYVLHDPTFDRANSFSISQKAIDSQSDGYFLVPVGALPQGWQNLSQKEAESVWGRGAASGHGGGECPGEPPQCCLPCGGCPSPPSGPPTPGMAKFDAWSSQAHVHIVDTPLSYRPPIGPAIDFSLNYNEGEGHQPSTFSFSNVSPNWSTNWVSYMTLDSSSNATVSVRGGGFETFANSGSTSAPVYSNAMSSQALLVFVSTGVFQRQLKDGSIEVFNLSDSAGNIYLTKVIDPQGNAATVTYDANFRVTGVADANGNKTAFSYVSNTVGNSGFYLISAFTDAFGRSATLAYDSSNTTLLSIIDAVGIVSKFSYETGSSTVESLTTPYGQTFFRRFIPLDNDGYGYPARGLKFEFPDGTTSIMENIIGETKKTYFWDREAMGLYPQDYTNNIYSHCKTTKWLYDPNGGVEAPVANWIKMPLESQVTYTYPGEYNNQDYVGNSNKPLTVKQMITGNGLENAVLSGSATAGDNVFITVNDIGLNGTSVELNYIVQTGDGLVQVAAGLAARINNYYDLQNVGTSATSTGNVLHISTTSNQTQSFGARSSGAGTEIVTLSASTNMPTAANLTGTITAGDTLTVTATDTALPSGHESFTYTVLAGDSLGKISSRLSQIINSDSNMALAGITANALGDSINLVSLSPNTTTFSQSTSAGATEAIAISTATTRSTSQLWQYTRNSFGQITQSVDPIGRTFTYNYAANNIDLLQKTETQGTDNYILGNWTYNSQHEPTTSIDGSGQHTVTAYNVFGEPITVTDPNSNTTTMTYAGTANATIAGTVATGNVLTITVVDSALSGGSKAVPYTTVAGDTTTTIATHLAANINAVTALQTLGVTATSTGAVVYLQSLSPNGTTYTKTITGAETITLSNIVNGFLQKVNGPLAGSQDVTAYSWNNSGTLKTKTDSEGYVLTYGYDNLDRLVSTTYPDGTSDTTTYQNLDPVFSKDRLGRVTQRAYTSLDQQASETDPLGRITKFFWCTCGSLMMLTDPNGNTTTWNHDLEGRVISKSYQDGTSTSTAYQSNNSRIQSTTDAMGQTTIFGYNLDDTLAKKAYSNAVNATSTVSYIYDPKFSRLTSVANGWGTYLYGYTPYITSTTGTPITGGGMLSSETNNAIANSAISYSYDNLDRISNRSINGAANSATWAYDAMSRVTSETNALGTFNYSYVDDVSGSSKGQTRLKSVGYPNTQVTNFSYYGNAGDERLTQIANLSSTSTVLSQFDYGYDPAGEITQWTQQNSSQSPVQYNNQYDQAGQLVAFNGNFGSQGPNLANRYNYAYDPGANRTAAQKIAVWPVKLGGTVTAGNTVTVTITDAGITGGSKAETYTVTSGQTLANIASGLAATITADSQMQAIGLNAVAHGQTVYIRSCSSNITTYAVSKSSGATETITSGIAANVVENATIAGTVTSGNTVTVNVLDTGLSGGKVAITYTVTASDTLTTIATGLKAAINANTSLSALGVTATSVGAVATIKSTSPNATTYISATSSGATETISLTTNFNVTQGALFRGTITTGNVLTLTVKDVALIGGLETVSYTVPSGATLTSIATAVAAAINADANLTAIGVSATSSGALVSLSSNSVNLTTYLFGKTLNGPETVVIGLPANGTQTAAIGGTKTTGDVLNLTIYDAGSTGGKETVTYTVVASDTLATIATALAAAVNADTNLAGVGVTAAAVSTVVNITSTSVNATTVAQSTSATATETIALGLTANVNQYACNNVNELANYAAGGQTTFQGTTSKPAKSVTVTSQALQINASAQPVTTFSSGLSGSNTMFLELNQSSNGNTTATVKGSAVTTGAVVSITVYNSKLTGGQITKSYTVASGNTYTSIAASLASLINADTHFPAIALSATSSGAVLTLTTKSPTYAITTNTGATETATIGYNNQGATIIGIGGKITSGDVITLTTTYTPLTGGTQAVHYTVLSTDTLTTLTAGLAAAVNANTNLSSAGVSSTGATTAALTTAQTFTAQKVIPAGSSNTTVSAVDGSSNAAANSYQLGINGSANTSLTYDLNGNLTNDGTNSYLWDAENKLIQIDYSGAGNGSQFTYDGLDQNVQIIEKSGGSITSTKEFIWSASQQQEARDAVGNLLSKYFPFGQISSGNNYFYTADQLGSVAEMTDSSGAIRAQYLYDAYGRTTKVQGAADSDFQYSTYYHHGPSNLGLALHRAYSSSVGRWLSRDPIQEEGGVNLYSYVMNAPNEHIDRSGNSFSDLGPGTSIGGHGGINPNPSPSPIPNPVPTPNPTPKPPLTPDPNPDPSCPHHCGGGKVYCPRVSAPAGPQPGDGFTFGRTPNSDNGGLINL